VIPFPDYIDMLSPPYADVFTILADASPLATPVFDNIRIFESLKVDVESRGLQATEEIAIGDIKAGNEASVHGIVNIFML